MIDDDDGETAQTLIRLTRLEWGICMGLVQKNVSKSA